MDWAEQPNYSWWQRVLETFNDPQVRAKVSEVREVWGDPDIRETYEELTKAGRRFRDAVKRAEPIAKAKNVAKTFYNVYKKSGNRE